MEDRLGFTFNPSNSTVSVYIYYLLAVVFPQPSRPCVQTHEGHSVCPPCGCHSVPCVIRFHVRGNHPILQSCSVLNLYPWRILRQWQHSVVFWDGSGDCLPCRRRNHIWLLNNLYQCSPVGLLYISIAAQVWFEVDQLVYVYNLRCLHSVACVMAREILSIRSRRSEVDDEGKGGNWLQQYFAVSMCLFAWDKMSINVAFCPE